MKISVYYESNYKKDYTWLDIDEDDMNEMIERDYQERLAKSDGKEPIQRRDPQTILNEEISKPTYNSHQRDNRRSIVYSAYEPHAIVKENDDNPEEKMISSEENAELLAALEHLQPQQRNLIKKIFWEGRSQRQIAEEEGIKENSLSERKQRALIMLKKILEKNSD